MKILLDTGPVKELKNIMLVDSPFTVSSVHGSSTIKEKCFMHIFGLKAQFFLLDTINTFDAIIGFNLLTQAGAALDLPNSVIRYGNISEQLKYQECDKVNFTNIDDLIVPNSVKVAFKKIILKRKQVFSHSNEALPFNTSIIATIRTETNEPV